MTDFRAGDPRDVILGLSAREAGTAQVEEFLRLKSANVDKRCFHRIMKRIRHSDIYRGGRLTGKATAAAAAMLMMLALLFGVVGFCSAVLTDMLTSGKDTTELFEPTAEETAGSEEKLREITSFRMPLGNEILSSNVLVRSSLLFNVELTTKEGTVYYSQKPAEAADNGEDIQKTSDADMYLVIGGNTAQVFVTYPGGEKSFELLWSDGEYDYCIYCAKSIEQAACLAQSVR